MYYMFKHTVNNGAFANPMAKEESWEITTSELYSQFGHFSA